MSKERFYRDRRAVLLRAWAETRASYEDAMATAGSYPPWSEEEIAGIAEANRQRARMAQVETDYFLEVPRLPLSVCPFCDAPLIRSFDPYGFDGLWWRADAPVEEPRACPHFQLLTGAVGYQDKQPVAAHFEVRPGPEIPYLIPSILGRESVVAVISEVPMRNGYIAYAIAYFANAPLKPEELTAEWRRNIYNYTAYDREDCWREPQDSWDFDIAKWTEAGRVRWCLPALEPLRLDAGGLCPYADLPGKKQPVTIYGSHVLALDAHDGLSAK